MRRLSSAIVIAITALLVSASPAAAQGFNWSGFYIGAHAGFGFSTPDFRAEEVMGIYNFDDVDGPVSGGFNFGGLVGFNRRIGRNIVVGGEFTIGKAGFNGEGFYGPGDDTRAETRGGLMWSAMGRAGYAYGRVVPYFTIGILSAGSKVTMFDDCVTGSCGGGTVDARGSGRASDLAWGIGAEIALNMTAMGKSSSIRVEWIKSDFSWFADATATPTFGGTPASSPVTFRFRTHFPEGIIRVAYVLEWSTK